MPRKKVATKPGRGGRGGKTPKKPSTPTGGSKS